MLFVLELDSIRCSIALFVENSSINIVQNISFCDPQMKESGLKGDNNTFFIYKRNSAVWKRIIASENETAVLGLQLLKVWNTFDIFCATYKKMI